MRILWLIVLINWALALGRTLLNLALVPRLHRNALSPEPQAPSPLVSILIPARDEERTIERTVRAMLAQTWSAIEVIVVNDRSQDRTGEILASIDDPRLIVHTGEEPPPGWLGKPWALHQASLRARGELLLFVDADVIYQPEAVAAAVERIETSGVAMIALLPDVVMKSFWEHVAMPMLSIAAFAFMPLWFANRTKVGVLGTGAGTGNLARRDAYDRVGGHEALKDAVVDDVALSRLFRRNGFRTEAVRADDVVAVRMYHTLGEIIDGFTKNTFAVFGNHVVYTAVAVAGMFVFHFAPYVVALTGDPVAIATVALITVTRLIIFTTLRYPLWNAILFHPLMIALWAWIVCRSAWYSGIRRQLRWRGRTYDAARTRFGAD